ncbi:hypothetical protein G6M89_21805 [Natronolimnobius sp. AArcel1]|nr:hypothetical protein [Natronolimnobius sp. AArcel1]
MDAVDDLSDAIDATRELLLPVQVGLWIKLAIVVFFIGGSLGMSGSVPAGDVGPVADETAVDAPIDEIPDKIIALAAVIVVILLALWFIYNALGAIMEFVFVESLRSRAVHVRRYMGQNLWRGLRLFGFRLVLGAIALGIVAIPALSVVLGTSTPEAALESLIPFVLLAIPVYLIYAILMRFTSEFVVPVMLLEERGVLSAWRRFWPTLTGNLGQFVVYLVLVWILQFVINFAAGFVILFGVVAIAIPFIILGVLAAMLGEIGLWIAGALAVVALVVVLLFVALVQMPIRTYFQYYALLLLGDRNPELDLISELRTTIRADSDRHDENGRNGRNGPPETDNADQSDIGGNHWDESDDTDTPLWDQSDDSSDWDSQDEEDDADGNDNRGW